MTEERRHPMTVLLCLESVTEEDLRALRTAGAGEVALVLTGGAMRQVGRCVSRAERVGSEHFAVASAALSTGLRAQTSTLSIGEFDRRLGMLEGTLQATLHAVDRLEARLDCPNVTHAIGIPGVFGDNGTLQRWRWCCSCGAHGYLGRFFSYRDARAMLEYVPLGEHPHNVTEAPGTHAPWCSGDAAHSADHPKLCMPPAWALQEPSPCGPLPRTLVVDPAPRARKAARRGR